MELHGRGRVLAKLNAIKPKLGEVSSIFVGLQTDADDVYILRQLKAGGGRVLCYSKATQNEHWFEDAHLKAFLKGSLNIRRYSVSDVNKRLIFPYVMVEGKSTLIKPEFYASQFPLTWSYLMVCKSILESRNKGHMGTSWYGYVYKKNHTRFELGKILVPSLATGSCFTADFEGKYFFVGSGGGGGGGYGIVVNEQCDFSRSYLLGILNSSLVTYIIRSTSTNFRGGYYALNRQYIEQIPIWKPDLANLSSKRSHDNITTFVDAMLALHVRLAAAKTPHEATSLQSQIDATDARIDAIVYELYGLTEDEIAIVEAVTDLEKE